MPDFFYRFSSVRFSGGEHISLSGSGLVILVGPNNSGKSRFLRDLETLWKGTSSADSVRVATEASVEFSKDWTSFENWIRDHYNVRPGREDRIQFQGIGGSIELRASHLDRNPNWMAWDQFRGFVISRLDTESRLALSRPPQRIDAHSDKPQHFVHVLQANEAVYERVRREVKSAFGLDVVIDFAGGSTISLFVGEEPDLQHGWDRVHPGYARSVRSQMDPLSEAGDGVRSYVVTLASALAEAQPVLLIDEPEAFLHPPQARRIGRLLGELATTRHRQVIVATHSSDFVRGAVSSAGQVAVVRVDRVKSGVGESVNHAHILGPGELSALWEKPLLKSSHAIDGIFHSGVVVCESDSDARFYESLLVRMEESGEINAPVDFHFVHGGGKSELSTLVGSYYTLRVPVAVIADFDLLREWAALERVVKSLGSDPLRFQHDFTVASSALSDRGPIKSEHDALAEIEAVVRGIRNGGDEQGSTISSSDRRKIYRALDDSKQWSEAKRYGIRKLLGEQRQAGERLLEGLAEIGLFVVPNGELESWDEALPAGRKDAWIRVALEKLSADASSFSAASFFVAQVSSFLDGRHASAA